MGSKSFIETIKDKLGTLAKGRKIFENDGGFQLREEVGTYIANFDIKNDDIGATAIIGILIIIFQLVSTARPQGKLKGVSQKEH